MVTMLAGAGCTNKNGQTSDEGKAASAEDVWIPTTCCMCFARCNVLAHKVGGVVTEIKGNPAASIGRGKVCGKGAAGFSLLYDPNRITKPMKRTNPKKAIDEDPGWVEITWDEAFSLMDEKLKYGMKQPGGVASTWSAACLHGSTVLGNALYGIYGASQYWMSDICGSAVHTSEEMFTGTGNAMPDYKYTKYVVQFGMQAGIATRHGYATSVQIFAESRVNGAKLVNFDPRMSAGAEKADLWVPIRPGTDAAAALAIAYVLVHEIGTLDTDFLAKRTNAPALVDISTKRIIRQKDTNKALYMDLSDNTVKSWDKATKPALEGTFTVDGKTCTTGFSLYKEHIKKYTPEYQEPITTVPAATIRRVAKELVENAHIGETMEIDGVTLPYRPVAIDAFSGISRHKHAMLTHWSIMHLNQLLGSCNAVGGFIGFAPACNGYSDTSPVTWRPTIWEEDGYTTCFTLASAWPHNVWETIRSNDFTPTSQQMLALMPYAIDPHFANIAQTQPDLYNMPPYSVLFVYADNPYKNWGNYDDSAANLQSFDYIIGCDLWLTDSSYFFDLFIPEACYLERYEGLPNNHLNHTTPGGIGQPWGIGFTQPVVAPKDGVLSIIEVMAELADRNNVTAGLVGALNYYYKVQQEKSVATDKKLDRLEFFDSVYRSVIDDKHGIEWFEKNGTYTHPRDVNEVYIWADDAPGLTPFYWDFNFEIKEKVDAKVAELGIPWETNDYVPLPEYRACADTIITDAGYDLLPIYWTDAINIDTYSVNNCFINEINEANPVGYTVEMNAQTARDRGLETGDMIRISNKHGASVIGQLVVTEKIHPECLGVLTGEVGHRSQYVPMSSGRGCASAHLVPGRDPARLDHTTAAFDQCVRCKVERV